MKRVELEKNYWQVNALDVDVENKYICNLDDDDRNKALGKMDGRVLEIGCGIGRLLKPHWFGIDISERMLKIAKNKKPYCNYLVCDGRTIPYEDNYFDFVYCVLVFQHIPFDGFIQYVQETKRVLKNGGGFRFQFIEGKEDEPFSKHYNLKKVKKTLEDAGFNLTSVKKGLGHAHWTWVKAVKSDLTAFGESDLKKDKEKNG